MFEMVNYTPKDIVIIYVVFMAACALTYPIVELIISAITRGVSRWK